MNLKKATTIVLFCSFILLLIVLTGCNNTNEYLEQIDFKTLKSKMDNNDNFILYVANKSCSHCKTFEPKFKSIINKYKITAYKLDTATITTDEYNEFLGIVGDIGTPTIFFFYDGDESGTTNRIEGDVSETKVIERLKSNKYIKD
jgi:predicted bacteriocin transport accessory protein